MVIPNFYGNGTLGVALHSPHNGALGLELLYSRTDCLSRPCEEIELPTSMNSWKRNKKGRCFKGVDLLSSIRGREAEKLQHTRVLSWFFKYFTAPTVKARILCAMARRLKASNAIGTVGIRDTARVLHVSPATGIK